MNWTIKFSSKAESYWKRIDPKRKERIKKELKFLSVLDHPQSHQHVLPLTGELTGFYRLRVGGYRIVFAIIPESQLIAVVNIAPRGACL